MPRFDFRCPKCGREFEVSRPFDRAFEPAFCVMDGAQCDKLTGGTDPQPAAFHGAFRHFGHVHGAGVPVHGHEAGN